MGVVRSGRSRSSSPCSSSIRRPVRSAASSDRARTSSYSKVGVTTSPSPNPQKTRRTASSITRSSAASVGRTSLVPAGVRRRTIRSPYRNRLSARDLAIAQQHLELSEQTGLRINPVLIAKTQAEIPLIALDVHLYWTRSREVCKQALQGPQRVLGQVLILQHDANGIIFPARREGLHPEGHYLGVCLILPVHFTSDLDDHVFLHQLPVFSKEFGEAKNLHRPLQPIQCHKGHRLTSLGCDLLHSAHHSYDRGTGSVTQAWKLRNQVLSFLPYLMAQIMQGVGRHVQAKCLLLQSQFLFLREIPSRDLRGPRPIGVSVAAPCHPALVLFGAGIHQVKNRTLTQSCIRLHLLAMPHSLCQYVQHALARTTRGVQSATLYQTLQRSLVQDRRIYAFAKLEDILEGTACLPLLQYVGDGADSHILHSIETKANAAVHRPEIQRGLVDIGRQHLYAHLVRNRHVEGHLVLGIHDAGYQGRHVLHGIISLQIGGAIGNQRVARGMRLVERVVPRFFHEVPKVINGLGSCAVLLSSLSELGLQPLQDGSDLLANTLAEIIRFRRGKAGDTLGDLHELFLIDSHAVCRAKHRLQPRIHVLHSFGVALVPDKLWDVLHRTRTIEGHQGNQIIKRDLIALVALYRPGPMEYIPQFVRNKRDPERVKYVDSRLEPVLRPTYGVAVYQEQLMEIAKRIAGFTPSEADDLRKGIGKKIRAVLERLEPKFREGAQENGTAPKAIDYLWNLMEKAGDYSFNKSHAACYALIAYRTAYLKANYPVEYMAALISSVMNTKDKVPFYVAVADEMGIEVLPPDVNESALDFRAVDGRIRFGLNAVKNVGVGAITYILEEREAGGPFEDIFEFCERVDTAVLNKRALESLIKCGALDSTGSSRKGMLHVLAQAVGHGQKVQSDAALGQGSIFDLMDAGTEQDQGGVAGGGNGYSNGSRSAEIPGGDFSQEEKLALEKEALGLYVSAHPLHDLRHQIRKEAENLISELPGLSDGASTTVVGMVSRVKQITTKAGEPMAFVTLDGLEGSVEVLCFPKFFGKHRELMKEDMVVKVRGKVDRKDETDTKIVPFRVESFAARREDDPICIVLEDKNLPKNTLGALKSLLAHFPGSCPIEVYIKGDEGNFRLRFGDQYRVDPQTSLFAELKVLLGDGKVSRGQPVAVG